MDYTKFVDTVHKYTNRDSSVLPNDLIRVFVDIACDNVYKDLRAAPLEYVYTYTALTADTDKLAVPGDAASFIQLRKLDSAGEVDCVFNAKSDMRSFHDESAKDWANAHYTRESNNFVIYPSGKIGDVYELFYYRRLPSVYARYAVNGDNNALGLLYFGATQNDCLNALLAAELDVTVNEAPNVADPDLESQIVFEDGTGTLPVGYYVGMLAPNWLRDENLSMILYGTCREAYIYLQDEARAASYDALFRKQVDELNDEDKRSRVSGGIATTHFSGNGLL